MMGTKEVDHVRLGEALCGGVTETDIPRDPFAPTFIALADLSRRVSLIFRRQWRERIRRSIELAARARAEHPDRAWPTYKEVSRAKLVAELRCLRPDLAESPNFTRVVEAEPGLLTELVDAERVIAAYMRSPMT